MGEAKKKAKDDAATDVGQAISGRILVAEDNHAIQDVVSRFLEFIGFEVALAGNGLEALSLFLKNSFDLVLTDLHMPVMDGWNLTSCIKEKSPDGPRSPGIEEMNIKRLSCRQKNQCCRQPDKMDPIEGSSRTYLD